MLPLEGQFWEGMVANGTITQDQLDITLRQHRHLVSLGQSSDFADLLLRNLFVTPQDVSSYLRAKGVSSASSAEIPLLPPGICLKYKVMPLRVEDGTLVLQSIASLDYTSKLMILSACPAKPLQIRTQLTDRATMQRALAKLGEHRTFDSQLDLVLRGDKTAADLRNSIDALLHEAIDLRASDIHLDRKPAPDSIISLRVDSKLQQRWILPEATMGSIFSRIKTLGDMDASDSRRSQDGRMMIEHRGRVVSFRVATQPVVNGETMSIRIIDAEMLPSPSQQFPNQQEMVQLFTSIAHAEGKSGGLVLITGPTGSGKSTTLYTLVSAMPRDIKNVVTVEDPVEFVLPFVRQILVNQLLNQKATDFERSVLRQDPDVLIFGEIRDGESARAALKFAESGHLVIASLHSKNAAQSVERLLSIIPETERAEAALVIAQTLLCIVNQQLVPRLCECAETFVDPQTFGTLAAALGHPPPEERRRACGCPKCDGSGYLGRTLLHETLVFDISDDGRHDLSIHLGKHRTLKGMPADAFHALTRETVAARLLAAGLVDDRTVIRTLRGAFSDNQAQVVE